MALSLNGRSDYLTRTSDVVNYNAAYTLMFWFDYQITNTFDAPIQIKGTGANWDLIYNFNTFYGLVLEVGLNGNNSEDPYFDGQLGWQHVAIRRNSATSINLLINATVFATVTTDVSSRAASNEQRTNKVGANEGNTNARSDWFLYDAALTDAEIANQMRFGYPLRTANLREWLPYHNNSTRNKDYSGNGRDYTEVGTINSSDSNPLVLPQLIYPKRFLPPPPPYSASPLGMLMSNF